MNKELLLNNIRIIKRGYLYKEKILINFFKKSVDNDIKSC